MAFVPGIPHYLGFGLTHPIALEGALKLKEITYALSADSSKTLTVD